MIVKMAVKDTPALTGRKLKQHYFKVWSPSPLCVLVVSFLLSCTKVDITVYVK